MKEPQIFRLFIATVLFFTIFSASRNFSQVVLSEIMFNPTGNEGQNEFIEIYNLSETDAIDLTGWQIADSISSDEIIAVDSGLVLQPGQFGLVLDPDYFGNATTYDSLVPATALVLTISGKTFGRYALSNSKPLQIFLQNSRGEKISSRRYTLDNDDGISEEKIVLSGKDNDSNWSNSLVIHGTPGFINSVSPRQRDLAFCDSAVTYSPKNPRQGENITFTFYIQNIGCEEIDAGEIVLFVDMNHDTFFDTSEKISSVVFNWTIAPKETASVDLQWENAPAGDYSLMAWLDVDDNDSTDNQYYFDFIVGYLPDQLVINEIMYNPLPGRAEWVELYNTSNLSIFLKNWQFSDSDTTHRMTLSQNISIEPSAFIVLSGQPLNWPVFGRDSSQTIISDNFPSLLNSGESLFLFDPQNNIIDHFDYSTTVITDNGYSLERINPRIPSAEIRNWGQSAARQGGTPGQQNSLFAASEPTEKNLSATPNPFSPDNDGFEDITLITYKLPMLTSRVNLKIFDIRGRLVRYLMNNEPSGSYRQIPWNGMDDQGQKCRMGIYILYLEAIDAANGILETIKKTVVVGGRL